MKYGLSDIRRELKKGSEVVAVYKRYGKGIADNGFEREYERREARIFINGEKFMMTENACQACRNHGSLVNVKRGVSLIPCDWDFDLADTIQEVFEVVALPKNARS